ncbi:hypothetical protein ABIE87_001007 [Bradyrhizobium diazoefficiens]
MLAGSSRRYTGGAGGCIATAGASLTTSRSARNAPIAAAAALSAPAITYRSGAFANTRNGKWKKSPNSPVTRSPSKVPTMLPRTIPAATIMATNLK